MSSASRAAREVEEAEDDELATLEEEAVSFALADPGELIHESSEG